MRGQLVRTSGEIMKATDAIKATDSHLARALGLPVDPSSRRRWLEGRRRLVRAVHYREKRRAV